jgi:hypothetical protein
MPCPRASNRSQVDCIESQSVEHAVGGMSGCVDFPNLLAAQVTLRDTMDERLPPADGAASRPAVAQRTGRSKDDHTARAQAPNSPARRRNSPANPDSMKHPCRRADETPRSSRRPSGIVRPGGRDEVDSREREAASENLLSPAFRKTRAASAGPRTRTPPAASTGLKHASEDLLQATARSTTGGAVHPADTTGHPVASPTTRDVLTDGDARASVPLIRGRHPTPVTLVLPSGAPMLGGGGAVGQQGTGVRMPDPTDHKRNAAPEPFIGGARKGEVSQRAPPPAMTLAEPAPPVALSSRSRM